MTGSARRPPDRSGADLTAAAIVPPPPDVIDPDVDLHDPQQRQRTPGRERAVVAVIALGGVLGAEARYLVGLAVPAAPAPFPLPTLLINVTGCLLLGVLLAATAEVGAGRQLVRPFLGTGVLGGFTTFSAFAVDAQGLVRAGHLLTALAYGGITLAAGAAATWLAVTLTSRLAPRRAAARAEAARGEAARGEAARGGAGGAR